MYVYTYVNILRNLLVGSHKTIQYFFGKKHIFSSKFMKYVLELCKIDVESMLLTFDDYLNYRVREHKILCVQLLCTPFILYTLVMQ